MQNAMRSQEEKLQNAMRSQEEKLQNAMCVHDSALTKMKVKLVKQHNSDIVLSTQEGIEKCELRHAALIEKCELRHAAQIEGYKKEQQQINILLSTERSSNKENIANSMVVQLKLDSVEKQLSTIKLENEQSAKMCEKLRIEKEGTMSALRKQSEESSINEVLLASKSSKMAEKASEKLQQQRKTFTEREAILKAEIKLMRKSSNDSDQEHLNNAKKIEALGIEKEAELVKWQAKTKALVARAVEEVTDAKEKEKQSMQLTHATSVEELQESQKVALNELEKEKQSLQQAQEKEKHSMQLTHATSVEELQESQKVALGELEKEKQSLQEAHEVTSSTHSASVLLLNTQHSQNISLLRDTHTDAIDALKETHLATVASLTQHHNEAIANLKTSFKDENKVLSSKITDANTLLLNEQAAKVSERTSGNGYSHPHPLLS